MLTYVGTAQCNQLVNSAGWAINITSWKLSVCLCVNQGGWHKSYLLHSETCNPACTDLLMSSGHKPKTRSVWPHLLAIYVILDIHLTYKAALPAEHDNVKVKVTWICIAPRREHTPKALTVHILKGSHSFTCTPSVHLLTEWTIPAFAFLAEAGTHLLIPEGWEAELALDWHRPLV